MRSTVEQCLSPANAGEGTHAERHCSSLPDCISHPLNFHNESLDVASYQGKEFRQS
jgi:hypothetical protein